MELNVRKSNGRKRICMFPRGVPAFIIHCCAANGSINGKYFIGTIGNSNLIQALVKLKQLNVKDLKGKWESFVVTTISKSQTRPKKTLVLAGSDKCVTLYGIYEISRLLCVSPWY